MSIVKVFFWDVQHGNAIYIKTPNNRHIVIDLGVGSYFDNNEEFSPLEFIKYQMGVEQVDYVIITHPHLDHIDDIMNFDLLSPKILLRPKHLERENILKNTREQDKEKFNKYFEINNRYNVPIDENSYDYPYNPDNWGGMKIKTFSPSKCSQSNINNHSIVTIIKYADSKIVFLGDNESCSYNELLENDEFKRWVKDSDILLASHHGRESGYHNEFVSLVNPRLTIVSDGRFQDTSATSRYSKKSRGWEVYKKDGSKQKRYCLTTRQDGRIKVEFGFNDKNSFLYVETGK